jgi:hypothetical protein
MKERKKKYKNNSITYLRIKKFKLNFAMTISYQQYVVLNLGK